MARYVRMLRLVKKAEYHNWEKMLNNMVGKGFYILWYHKEKIIYCSLEKF